MATWNGWQRQLLNAAALPTSADNLKFMADWNQHANTNCHNNPVDISLNISGASPCKVTSNPQHTARNFASHDQAAGQFAAQLRNGPYPDLLAALRGGQPYTPAQSARVGGDLLTWGSGKFAAAYAQEVNSQIDAGAGTPTGIHKGWNDLRTTVNHRLPSDLRSADKSVSAALRSLGRARKVRL